eukprot:TRINITY_DN17256_c0_g1_i1.p1 TRINITY_DN17256_c0_g1~~TRINITY_DN17256_c0_g1_i1.p1  ORF type:complete len:730 (-),score=119.53 TRINITY_DN17256_c0_g1_i1:340-2529(-)
MDNPDLLDQPGRKAMDKKKKGPANLEEAGRLISELSSEVADCRFELSRQCEETRDCTTQEIEDFKKVLEDNTLTSTFAQQKILEICQQHGTTLRSGLMEEIKTVISNVEKVIRADLDPFKETVKEFISKQTELNEHYKSITKSTSKDLEMLTETAKIEVSQLGEQCIILNEKLNRTNDAFGTRCEKIHTNFSDRLTFLEEEFGSKIDQNSHKAEDIDKRQSQAIDDLEALATSTRSWAEDMFKKTVINCESQLNTLRYQHTNLLANLDVRTVAIEDVIAEVENIPTRRVDWIVKDVSSKLQEMTKQSTDESPMFWRSPKFEAAGAHDLRMDLQFLRPPEIQSMLSESSLGPQGDCTVTLHGDKGMFMVFRVYVGKAFMQLEHTFDADHPSCSSKIVCFIKDQINQEQDSLTVGFEVLEAIRAVPKEVTTELAIKQEKRAGREPCSSQMGGSVVSHRYLNHRMLDIVQDQVNLIRSSMVRRIEWKIEKAGMLRRCFPEGESLCSSTFEAAGVDNLQLVFYPSGIQGAREGFCSYFLYCPAGTMLKCYLSVGKQRREARTACDRPGFSGRSNFCRFDSCTEMGEDSVLLVLEIDEAQQNIKDVLSHRPKVSAVQTSVDGSRFEGTSTLSTEKDPGSPVLPEKIESNVRLQRVPGNKQLQETRQLPSIWTSQPKADVLETLEGYHSFSSFHELQKRPTTGKQKLYAGVAWKSDPKPQPLSARSVDRYNMYAS